MQVQGVWSQKYHQSKYLGFVPCEARCPSSAHIRNISMFTINKFCAHHPPFPFPIHIFWAANHMFSENHYSVQSPWPWRVLCPWPVELTEVSRLSIIILCALDEESCSYVVVLLPPPQQLHPGLLDCALLSEQTPWSHSVVHLHLCHGISGMCIMTFLSE